MLSTLTLTAGRSSSLARRYLRKHVKPRPIGCRSMQSGSEGNGKWIDSTRDAHFPQQDFFLWPDFLSPEEHDQLVQECERKLKRQQPRYRESHFDSVISHYREANVRDWTEPQTARILQRTQALVERECNAGSAIPWQPVHILDLAARGSIGAHIDHKEYLGRYICGLSLLSDCVMRLRKDQHPELYVDVWIPARSLYVQRDRVRFGYSHELVAQQRPDGSRWYAFGSGEAVQQQRRISVLFRDVHTSRSAPVS